jgi:hypothetical protein
MGILSGMLIVAVVKILTGKKISPTHQSKIDLKASMQPSTDDQTHEKKATSFFYKNIIRLKKLYKSLLTLF